MFNANQSKKDYENYDYIEIIVKRESADEIINGYARLLWTLNEQKEDKRYHDLIHLSFYRPHKIQNKDRLQLLQVYYENIINEKACILENKNSKAMALIFTVSAFMILAFIGVGVLVYSLFSWWACLIGAVVLIAVTLGGFLCFRALKRLYSKEKLNKIYKCELLTENAKNLLEQIDCLVAGTNYEV